MQICSLCCWAFIAAASIQTHHSVTLMALTGDLWITMLSVQVATAVSTSWTLDHNLLSTKTLWRTQQIPYLDIKYVSRGGSLWTLTRNQIEIEYGKPDSSLNPRGTATATLKDQDGFFKELRSKTPQAQFHI